MNLLKKNDQEELVDETSNLKLTKCEFGNINIDFEFITKEMANKLKTIYNGFERSLQRFTIFNTNKDYKITSDHDMLFKTFKDEPNEISKTQYTNYCKNNGIEFNPITIENIVILNDLKMALNQNSKILNKITKNIEKTLGTSFSYNLDNTNDENNEKSIESKSQRTIKAER